MVNTAQCTIFPDVHARQKEVRAWAPDLLDDETIWPSKGACPLVKFARFGDALTPQGSYRSDANVEAISGAEADYDAGELSMDVAIAALEPVGIQAVFYTSASNTPEKPRWRLLLPFAEEYTGSPDEMKAWRGAALRKAEDIIGVAFASESYTLSQSFYIGQVRGSHYDYHLCDGTPIDEVVKITDAPVLPAPVVMPGQQSASSHEEAEYYLSHVAPGCDYPQWVHVGMALRAGLGADGFDLWRDWSARDPDKYPGEREMAHKWVTFQGEGIGFGTLVHLAREGGADPKKFDDPCHGLSNLEQRMADGPTVSALMAHPTEDNVALAFAEKYRGKYVYMHGSGNWYEWDGARWATDRTQSVYETIRDLARAHNTDGKAGPARSAFVKGVAAHLMHDRRFARHLEDFDKDTYLLNCLDGTYNLHTMTRCEHDPEDCITYVTGASPTEKDGALFRKFLKEITQGDKSLGDFLQIALGACLSGAVEEHWFMFWTGKGRNGKNTLGDRVLKVMGDYARVIPSATLLSQRGQAHATEIMSLKGMRLVVSSEVEEGSHWAETKVKELTGDEFLSGRLMRQDWVFFRRTHKHLVYGNYRPQLRNVDIGIRSRLKIVPFKASFAGREDADLPAKLDAESGYILWWLMQGHQRWTDGGKTIGTCPAVEAETHDYYESQSTVDTWIEECCVVRDPEAHPLRYWAKASEAYNSYRLWKEARGEHPSSQTRFSEQLGQRFTKKRGDGIRFSGLRLKTYAEPD
jgi:putative DNA primase/helicase